MSNTIQHFSDLISGRIDHLNIEKNPENLYDPIGYLLHLGGKRLRPLMALLSYNLYGDSPESALDASVGIEVFHNFTLMHDDIMDEAPLRRSMPTVHMKWNPNIAILSGDVMFVKAYELIMRVEDTKLRPILDAFNGCAKRVCEGQQIDMDFEAKVEVLEDEYIEMIRLKTAVLLGFCMELGAIIGGAPDSHVKALKSFGENLGIGFQLKDDILDVYADQDKFGKQVGGDIIANKKTFLWIEAWKNADKETRETLEYWLNKESFDPEEKVRNITNLFDLLNIKSISESKMNQYFDKAIVILQELNILDDKKQLLLSFSQQLIAREH